MKGVHWVALVMLPLLLVAAVAGWWVQGTRRDQVAGYATSLAGRTENQRRNALLAARALDNAVIRPGAEFSFNAVVKGWAQDDGYVKAPVSYDGELVRAYGGGVCQASTTLYNAALLAGLPILERHPHSFHPEYATPGRDAAVAYPGVDLRFSNPYDAPLRIRAKVFGDILSIRLEGPILRHEAVRLQTQMLSRTAPERQTRTLRGDGRVRRNYLRSPGLAGCRAVTWRIFYRDGRICRREKLSDDSYATMDRVVALAP